MTLRISFDFHSSLLWLVDYSEGLFLENVIINSDGFFEAKYLDINKKPYQELYPEERLKGRKDLEEACNYLNSIYPTLFINNEIEFSYKGFDSKEEKIKFLSVLEKFCSEVKQLLGDKYKLEIEEGIAKERNW